MRRFLHWEAPEHGDADQLIVTPVAMEATLAIALVLTFEFEEVQVPANAVPALMVIVAVAAVEEVQAPANAVPAPMAIELVVAAVEIGIVGVQAPANAVPALMAIELVVAGIEIVVVRSLCCPMT